MESFVSLNLTNNIIKKNEGIYKCKLPRKDCINDNQRSILGWVSKLECCNSISLFQGKNLLNSNQLLWPKSNFSYLFE